MGSSLRLLLVEDSEDDAELVVRELERGGYDLAFTRVETAEEMAAALSEQSWDVVISDYAMPHFSGPDALGVMREQGKDLPFIVVSGVVGEEIAIPVLQGGAHDFVAKDNLTRLLPAVQRELRDAEERRQRRRAQEALLQREAFFRCLIENTSDLILVLNSEGIIRYVSPSAERALGRESPPRVGMPVTELIHADDAPEVTRALARANGEPGALQTLDVRYKRRDGTYHVFEAVGSSFRDESGATRIVINARDITDRRRAELELLANQKKLRQATTALALAEERERRRIAADLHDNLGQTLAVAGMKLSEARRTAPAGDLAHSLDEVGELIQQVIQDTRSLTFELSPPVLYELGIEAAVEQLGEQVREEYGIAASVEDDGRPKPLDADMSVVLFRSVRELLVNVAKHAQTDSAKVSMRRDGDTIRIGVEDEGAGFEPSRVLAEADDAAGFGIFSIRERLSHFGGRLEIDSEPGRGTRATLVAPLQSEDAAVEEAMP